MAGKRVVDFIQDDACNFRVWLKAGFIPIHYSSYYQIYCFYTTLGKMKKMDRYTFTAEQLKVSVDTVRKAVKEMQREML